MMVSIQALYSTDSFNLPGGILLGAQRTGPAEKAYGVDI